MSETHLYPVAKDVQARALINNQQYLDMYQASIEDDESFWREQGLRLDWIKPYTQIKDVSFDKADLHVRWFYDGTLNVCGNCVDRHLDERGDQIAIIWEGDDPTEHAHITYRELHERVCRFANALKARGIVKGDRVTLYMPMIPEAAVAMLACARIGAVHSVVFGGFSPDALAGRIVDCQSKAVITADEGIRGGKSIPLKRNVDEACQRPGVLDVLETVIVVRATFSDVENGWQDITGTHKSFDRSQPSRFVLVFLDRRAEVD